MVLSNEIRDAALSGDTAAIQEWFSTGTRDPDDRDQLGHTLLHWAARYGRCDMMRFLLAHGASVDVTTNSGYTHFYTPLSRAAERGHCAAAVLLLDRGAQIDLADNIGSTPLIRAAGQGHCDMIRLLLRRGANLAARNNNGRDAEANARYQYKDSSEEAASLLADIRRAGGWLSYLRYPRKRLLALRVLCERGRAKTDDALLQRLFPWHAPAADWDADDEGAERPSLFARAAQGPRELPKEVFWLVFKFWRSDRDARD